MRNDQIAIKLAEARVVELNDFIDKCEEEYFIESVTVVIDCREISNKNYVDSIRKRLPEKKSCTYVFKVVENHDRIDIKTEMKKFNLIRGADYPTSRINEKRDGDCLYVGKSFSVKTRVLNHILGSRRTYSLQLARFLAGRNLKIEMQVTSYRDIPDFILADLESHLHDDLKPILGKAGGL